MEMVLLDRIVLWKNGTVNGMVVIEILMATKRNCLAAQWEKHGSGKNGILQFELISKGFYVNDKNMVIVFIILKWKTKSESDSKNGEVLN